MTKRKRTIRKPTDTERTNLAAAIREEQAGKASNRALGRKLQERRTSTDAARDVLQALAAVREAKNVSLSRLEELTGMTRGNLSRLWNNPEPNVTVATLDRIASALGCRIHIKLEKTK